jgi:hypothetical protein
LGAAGTGDPYYYGYVRWNQSTTTLDIAAQDGTGAGGLRFLTGGGSTSPTERVRIDVSGRVGIGTTSPSHTLDVATGYANLSGVRIGGDGENDIYRNATLFISCSDTLVFKTGAGPTERARIDSSGRLLVGTSSTVRDSRLCVRGNASGSFTGDLELGAAAGYASISSDNSIGVLRFTEQTNGGIFAQLYCETDGTPGNGDYPGRLVFSTTADGASSPTERMRIRSDGTILMNTTITSVSNVGFQFTAAGIFFDSVDASTNETNTLHVYSTNASAYRFYVGMDGTVNATNTTISAISDQRLKENIRDLDAGLTEILALKPRRFDWKAGKGKNIQNDQGFIAQEFEQVFPEMIGEWLDPSPEGEEPYKSVRADLIPVLVKAIQEQQAIINVLEARLSVLESK